MRVRVLFFGPLVDQLGRREDILEVPERAKACDIYAHYQRLYPGIGQLGRTLLLAINQEFSGPDTAIHEADEIAFLPPMSGGSQAAAVEEAVVAEITREPIDREALERRGSSPRDGAIVTFDGIVRGNTGGKSTLYLEYEAYEPMARRRIREIAHDARRRWPVSSILVVHRLGRIEVGQSSVLIVVAAAHRRPAFEACSFVIDTLKKSVPIWKKEFFSDGSVWVEGELPDAASSSDKR